MSMTHSLQTPPPSLSFCSPPDLLIPILISWDRQQKQKTLISSPSRALSSDKICSESKFGLKLFCSWWSDAGVEISWSVANPAWLKRDWGQSTDVDKKVSTSVEFHSDNTFRAELCFQQNLRSQRFANISKTKLWPWRILSKPEKCDFIQFGDLLQKALSRTAVSEDGEISANNEWK